MHIAWESKLRIMVFSVRISNIDPEAKVVMIYSFIRGLT